MEAYNSSLVRASVPFRGSRFSFVFGQNVSNVALSFTSWKHSHHVKGGFEISAPFSSLVARLRHEANHGAGAKKNAPLWAPIASHGNAYDHDVSHLTALVLDYDAGSLDLQTAAEQLQNSGLAFLLHDSPSATPTHHKWRLVLPLSKPVLPAQWNQLYLAAAQLVGAYLLPASESFDLSCHNPAHRWFMPWRRDKQQPLRRVLEGPGATFDIEKLTAQLPRPQLVIHKQAPPIERTDATERARRYLRSMDAAIGGQGGHNQTFRAARVLVLDFALDAETAFSLLWQEFNPRCSPPWNERELRHKVSDALKLQGQRGKLLEETTPQKPRREPTLFPTAKKKLLVKEGELLQQKELLAAENRDSITVLQVPCGGGKSHAALTTAKLLSLLQQTDDGLDRAGKTALLGPTHQWAEEMLFRSAEVGLSATRYFSPPGEGGLRAMPPKGAPKGTKAPLLCKLSRSALSAHYAAGWQGQEICFLCPFKEECPSKIGRVGPNTPRLAIATHQNPKAAIQDARRVWVDEWPELLEQKTAKKEALRILQNGLESLGPKSQKVIAKAAAAVLAWLNAGAEEAIDPLTEHRAALKELCDDGRPKLRRTPDNDPFARNEEIGAARDAEAWKGATWLLEAAVNEAKLFQTSDKEPAYHVETPIAQVLREARRVVILSATPRDIKELEKITGKKVHLVTLPIEGTAPRELVQLKTRSATRRSYLENGRLRLTRKHTRKGIVKTETAPLVSDLNAVAKYLRQKPDLNAAFLATFRPVAAALRLILGAGQGGASTNDRAYWEGLYGSAQAAQEALSELQTAVGPLLLWAKEKSLVVAHYGALEGLDSFKEADAFVTVGDPNANLDDHQRRYALVRGVEAKGDSEWQTQYDQEAAAELCQAHGRDRWPTRKKAVYHLHIGATAPMGWAEETQTEQRLGRPQNEAGVEGWQELVARGVVTAGGVKALARVLDVDARSVRRFQSGERQPTPEQVKRLAEFVPGSKERGGADSPIPAKAPRVLIGESASPTPKSLNRGIGLSTLVQYPRVLIGESASPPPGSLQGS